MKKKRHFFDRDVAIELGVNAAIVFSHLRFWIEQNRKTGKNLREGSTWVFQSVSKMTAAMPYLSAKQIRSSVKTLISRGFLKQGRFNAKRYDRTLWYALDDSATSTSPDGKSHLPCKANGCASEGEPIQIEKKMKESRSTKAADEASIISEENPDRDAEVSGQDVLSTVFAPVAAFSSFWDRFPKRSNFGKAQAAWDSAMQSVDAPFPEFVFLSLREQVRRNDNWRAEGGKWVPAPHTWIENRRWLDEPERQAYPGETLIQRMQPGSFIRSAQAILESISSKARRRIPMSSDDFNQLAREDLKERFRFELDGSEAAPFLFIEITSDFGLLPIDIQDVLLEWLAHPKFCAEAKLLFPGAFDVIERHLSPGWYRQRLAEADAYAAANPEIFDIRPPVNFGDKINGLRRAAVECAEPTSDGETRQ